MLTIFTIPKPFHGLIGTIQTNAIKSWCKLKPQCEVILVGDEDGTAEIADELGVINIPEFERNEYGTPMLDHVFRKAHETATYDKLAFINTDIILTNDILDAVSRIDYEKFLMIGQRWDLDVEELIDFDDPDWELHLRARVKKSGSLHPPSGVDYYLYTKGIFDDIPPYAVGRTGYDNWFIYHVRQQGVPVINSTAMVMNVHQNHERTYSSVGLAGPQGETELTKGVERGRNIALMGGRDHAFNLHYATHILNRDGVKPDISPKSRYFRMRAAVVLQKSLNLMIPLFRLTDIIVQRMVRH